MKTQDPTKPLSAPPAQDPVQIPPLTEQDLKIQLDMLRQHVAQRDMMFLASRAAAGQLSEMDAAAVQAFDQNEQADTLNSIEGQAYLGGIRSPEMITGLTDSMANFERQYAGRLSPDYPERKKRILDLTKMVPALESEGQLLQEAIPELLAKHSGVLSSIGRVVGKGMTGLFGGLGEPTPGSRSEAVAKDIKELLDDITAHHYGEQPPIHTTSNFGLAMPKLPTSTWSDPIASKRGAPGGLKGTNKEAFRAALAERVQPIIQKLANDGGVDDSAVEHFASQVAETIGMFVPISATSHIATKGIEKAIKIIKGTEEVGKVGNFFARHGGLMAGFGALEAAKPLSDEQKKRIESLPEDYRHIASILARVENGTMGALTAPVFHVGSKLGSGVQKLIGGAPNTMRGIFSHVAGGAAMGSVFPVLGDVGNYAYNKLKGTQEGDGIIGQMMEKGLLSKPHIGGLTVDLMKAFQTGEGLPEAIESYAKGAAPGMVAFGTIGLARAAAEVAGYKRGNELIAMADAKAEAAKAELVKAAGEDKAAVEPVAEKIVEQKIEEIRQVVQEQATPKDRAVDAVTADIEAKEAVQAPKIDIPDKPRVSRRQLEEGGATEVGIRKAVERGELVDEGEGEWFQVPRINATKKPSLGRRHADIILEEEKARSRAKAEAKVEKLIQEDAKVERVLGPAKEVRSVDEAIKEVRSKFGKPISQQEREDLRAKEESLRYEKAAAEVPPSSPEAEQVRNRAKAKAVAARVPPSPERTASETMASETIADTVAKERSEKKVEAAVISGEIDSREATLEVKNRIAEFQEQLRSAKKQPEHSATELARIESDLESYVEGLKSTGRPVSLKMGKSVTPLSEMNSEKLRKLTRDPKWKSLQIVVGEKGKAAPAEKSEELSIREDGISGREVPPSSVPFGDGDYQYVVGKVEEDGGTAIYRRRASERGTYGGWRFEADASREIVATTPEARDEIRMEAMEAKAEIAAVEGTPLEAKIAKENAPEIEKAKEMEAKLKEEAVAEIVKADSEGKTLVQEPVEGLSRERADQVKKAMKRPKKATGKEHLGPGDKDAYAIEMAAAEDIARAKIDSFKKIAKDLIKNPWSSFTKSNFEVVKHSRPISFFENLSPEDEAAYRTSPKTADLFEQLVKLRASLPPSQNYSGLPIVPALKQLWKWLRSGQLSAEASMHAVLERDPQTKASLFRRLPLVGKSFESPTAWAGWVAAKAIKALATSRAGVAATVDRMINAPGSPLQGINRGDLKDQPIFRLLDKWDKRVADMVAEVDAAILETQTEIAEIRAKKKPGKHDAEHIEILESDIKRLEVDRERISKLPEFEHYSKAAAGTEEADIFDRALRLKQWLETARDEILKVHPTILDWRRRIGAAEEDLRIAEAEIARMQALVDQVKDLRNSDPTIRALVDRRAQIRKQAKNGGLTSAMVAELKDLSRKEVSILNKLGLRPMKQLRGAMRPYYQARSYANEVIKSRTAEINRMTQDWGLRTYVRHMAELDLSANENPATRDETTEVVIPGQFAGEKVRTRASSPILMRRKGALEAAGNMEQSALRSMYAYIHYVWPFIERSKLLGETHEFLYGKLKLIPDEVHKYGNQVIHQDSLWTTSGMVREVISAKGDVSYVRWTNPTQIENIQRFERASEVASEGLNVDTPRVDYHRVLLSRGLRPPTDAQLADPAWVKRNVGPTGNGNVKVMDTATAKTSIRAYRDGWFSRADSIRSEDMQTYINTVTQAMTEDQHAIIKAFMRGARLITSGLTANALGGPLNLHNATNAMTGSLALQMVMHGPGILKHIRTLTRYGRYMFSGGNKAFDMDRMDAGASQSYRTTPAELAKLSPAEQAKRVVEDNMFEDFRRSGVTSGNRGDQMRTLLGWRGDVAHADPRPGKLAKVFEAAEKVWWWPFNSGEYVMRWLPWADGYMSAIAEGKNRSEAMANAFNRVHLTQMIYNQAARSKFFNHPMGQVLGNLSTWSAHWSGRMAQLALDDPKAALYVMGVTTAQMWIGAQLGLNVFNALGSMVGSLPWVGKPIQNRLLGIGKKDEDDPLGVNPKGHLYNWGLRSIPIPIPVPALESPMVKGVRSLWNYVEEVANGNGEAASRQLNQALQVFSPLHGSQAKQIRWAFFDGTPDPDGSVLHTSAVTGNASVRTTHSGILEYVLQSGPGTRWALSEQYENAELSRASNEMLRKRQKEASALGMDTVRAYDRWKSSGEEEDKLVYQQLRQELEKTKKALGTKLAARDVAGYRKAIEKSDLMDVTSRAILGAPNKLQRLTNLTMALENDGYDMSEEQFTKLVQKLSGSAGWQQWRASITVPPAIQKRFEVAYQKRKAEWAK